MIRYRCPGCKSELESEVSLAGKSDICPVCQKVVPVPTPSSVVPTIMKDCPFCGEEIKASAVKCKHCNEYLKGWKPAVLTRGSDQRRSSGMGKPSESVAGTVIKSIVMTGFLLLGGGIIVAYLTSNISILGSNPVGSKPEQTPAQPAANSANATEEAKGRQKKAIKEGLQQLVRQLRTMQSFRQIGGNYEQHQQQLLQLMTAYQEAKALRLPSDPTCERILRNTERSIEQYKDACVWWGYVIKGQEWERGDMQRSFAEADKRLDEALTDYRLLIEPEI